MGSNWRLRRDNKQTENRGWMTLVKIVSSLFNNDPISFPIRFYYVAASGIIDKINNETEIRTFKYRNIISPEHVRVLPVFSDDENHEKLMKILIGKLQCSLWFVGAAASN